jgi:hypothetical protein
VITLCQISTNLINEDIDQTDAASRYYSSIWKEKERYGYFKPDDYWEIPLWMTKVSGVLNHNNVNHCKQVIKNQAVKLDYFRNNGPFMFSVLDCNKEIIRNIILNHKNLTFVLGGYVDWSYFDGIENIQIYKNIESLCIGFGYDYTEDVSYHLFHGENCIPRLTLSTGCKYRCKFCSIPNNVTEIDRKTIFQQVTAMIGDINFDLIYIDDKTFGQSDNYKLLKDISIFIKSHGMPNFKGFIVQTTAPMVNRIDFDGLNIFAVEIGVESYNDEILKKYRKPANRQSIEHAMHVLDYHNIKFIPNIIIGLLEENSSTYTNTYNWVEKNREDIFLLNIYNLAIYEDTQLSEEVEFTEDDSNELTIERSYATGRKGKLDQAFSDLLFDNAISIIKEPTYIGHLKYLD